MKMPACFEKFFLYRNACQGARIRRYNIRRNRYMTLHNANMKANPIRRSSPQTSAVHDFLPRSPSTISTSPSEPGRIDRKKLCWKFFGGKRLYETLLAPNKRAAIIFFVFSTTICSGCGAALLPGVLGDASTLLSLGSFGQTVIQMTYAASESGTVAVGRMPAQYGDNEPRMLVEAWEQNYQLIKKANGSRKMSDGKKLSPWLSEDPRDQGRRLH